MKKLNCLLLVLVILTVAWSCCLVSAFSEQDLLKTLGRTPKIDASKEAVDPKQRVQLEIFQKAYQNCVASCKLGATCTEACNLIKPRDDNRMNSKYHAIK